MKKNICLFMLITTAACVPGGQGHKYPFPKLPTAHEKLASIDVAYTGNLCPGGGGTFTLSGNYGLDVVRRTYYKENDVCKFTAKNETMNLAYSTNKNSAVTPIRDTTVDDSSPLFKCEGVHFVHPQSPIWLNHEGWGCHAFNIDVSDPLGRTVGGVDESCQLKMTADAPRAVQLTITFKSKNSDAVKRYQGGCF